MATEFERRAEAFRAIRDAEVFGASEVWLGYNADGDLVEVKQEVDGKWFKRAVKLAGVTDFDVDSWDKFEGWGEVS